MDRERGAPALRVEAVSKSYGSRKALDAVSLHVDPSESVALLGPNGAGKSTLFQLLSGLFAADAGVITIGGQDVARSPTRALAELGCVFQQPTLDLELSVEANLRFYAGLHGLAPRLARTRIAEALAQFGLAPRAHELARTLSGGNRRRLELARALLNAPRVLLMDEATVGLDPVSRADLLTLVQTLRRDRGVAVLWATHLCDEVTRADRVVILHEGRILSDTSPAQLLADTGAASIEDALITKTSLLG